MKLFKFGLFIVVFMALTGCAHKTPVTDGETALFCNFQRYELNLDHRNKKSSATIDSTVQGLNATLSAGFSTDSKSPIPKNDMLFMSGGSLNGAFGAGVLAGWAENRGCKPISLEDNLVERDCLPAFSVVTGVSTGAILSLAAFANVPEAAVDGYTIEKESEAITAFVKRDKNGKVGVSSYITALRKGGLADLTPLQNSIYDNAAKYNLFKLIAKGADENRKLLAGVVDVDTGKAVVLDMTLMAKRIRDFNPGFDFRQGESVKDLKKRDDKMGHLVDCFTRGIAASSSVPLAARPIAIDNRLYIDGGARFLLFSDVIGPVIDSDVDFNFTKDKKEFKPINVYMLINGDQTITPKCAKKDCKDILDSQNYWAIKGAREDWNVLELIERTVDVLQTQVGEFSESEIRFRTLELALERKGVDLDELIVSGVTTLISPSFQKKVREKNVSLTGDNQEVVSANLTSLLLETFSINSPVRSFTHMQSEDISDTIINNFKNYRLNSKKITAQTLKHKYEDKTCTQWREYDEKNGRNLQFHPNYMKCMIDAGRTVIQANGWDN